MVGADAGDAQHLKLATIAGLHRRLQQRYHETPLGVVTLKVPLIAVGKVPIDMVSIEPSREEKRAAAPGCRKPPRERTHSYRSPDRTGLHEAESQPKDLANLVELLKRGKIDIPGTDRYLPQHAPSFLHPWEQVKAIAAREE